MPAKKATNIDEYIEDFPNDVQQHLKQIRATIKKTVPAAEEKISYGIPSFTLNGSYLVYFAGYKTHIGLYPVPSKGFEKDFAIYKTSGKGTIQFPLDKPMSLTLITKIVKFMKKQNEERAKNKVKR